ncbi:MAG TPA: TonB-dependent receptor [Steroidobacteraceae bacterium]|nr:TonB-dependent receptor [Steroidobacteraceae bacterium]
MTNNLVLASAIRRSLPFAGAVLAGTGVAQAQQSTDVGLEEVVVSAQKRDESLQDVPLSIQAIGQKELAELKVNDFGDYVKFLPNVSYQTYGPGFSRPYMRGVASGENANHSGPLPSVGVYLDEQPITTIQGPLDVQIYDIARVEVLAGPQGTLYGASSQAGTIRIITNKPKVGEFDAGYELTGSTLEGDLGYTGQGFVNIPVGDKAAIRLVGWTTYEPGFIDNVRSTRVFPTSGIALDNSARVEDNYNDVRKSGARLALGINLNDSWTLTPTVMAQKSVAHGAFGFDPLEGDLKVAHALPEGIDDKWVQAALTLQGKIGNWDMTYAGAYLKRDDDTKSDYADYAFFYDSCCGYGNYFYDNDGALIDPSQFIVGTDRYKKQSHELRFSSPAENRWRVTLGAFTQKQDHGIHQDYQVAGLSDEVAVTGNPDTIWLTEQQRTDKDDALFGELTFDITDKLSVTGGARFFESENSLYGFFGYSSTYSGMTGESQCFDPRPFRAAPCVNLDKTVKEDGNTKRLNLTFHATDDVMLYATWSEGFRPGGLNRKGTLPPYKSDFLTNYEIGFKTTWAGNRLRFNGAFFVDDWDDFQYSYLGANGLTEIRNAGQARIKGFETDIVWAVTDGFTLSTALSFLDAKTTQDYCGSLYGGDNVDASPPYVLPGDPLFGEPVTNCSDPRAPNGTIVQAPKGQELPVQPKFKGNAIGRYEFAAGAQRAHVQAAWVYQGSAWSDLRTAERNLLGKQPSYSIVDFAGGIDNDSWGLELFVKNAFDERAEIARYAECSTFQPAGEGIPVASVPLCGLQPYTVTNTPRTVGLTFTKHF